MDYGNNKSGDYGRGKGKNDYSGSKVRYNEKEGTFESGCRYNGSKGGFSDGNAKKGARSSGGGMNPRADLRNGGHQVYERHNSGKKPYNERYDRYDERGQKRLYERGGDVTAPFAPGMNAAQNAPASEDALPNILMGRNAVKEAVKSGTSIDKLLVSSEQDGSLREIIGLARDRNIIIHEVARQKLDEICMPFGHGQKTGNHQGIVAYVPGIDYCDISDILNLAQERGEKPFILLLDGIEDPHNMGSIIRSAVCAGVHGVVIPKRRSVSITAAVSKTSAGAVSHMLISRVSNLGGVIDRLKGEGLWIAGADMAGTSMYETDLRGAIALVIGSEGEGLGRLIKEKCDFLVSIPMFSELDSLNASVAAGILMFEKKRRDR